MRNLVLATLFASLFGSCCAQTASSKPVEPTALGTVYLLDSSNQTLKPLPDEPWKSIGKPGWTTVTGIIQISGERSSFRIKASDKTEFVFKVGQPENVKLYPFVQKKSNRQLQLVVMKGAFSKQQTTYQGIPVEITNFGESSYKLVPVAPLGPGEYAIDASGKLFTFGVD